MFNPVVMKKWTALILSPLFVVIGFYVALLFYGFWIALVVMLLFMVVFALFANMMLAHPLRDVAEGAGLLFIDWTSTGILRPFIAKINGDRVKGKIGPNEVREIYDRDSQLTLAPPKILKNKVQFLSDEYGKKYMKLIINEEEYNDSKFLIGGFPTILYNSQVRTIFTKQFLADMEKDTSADHIILYLNRLMEDHTALQRDFARGVIEALKPKMGGIFKNPWFWIVIVAAVLIVIAVVMTNPDAFAAFGAAGDSIGGLIPQQAPPTG